MSFLLTAHCITNTTVGMTILFIWISAVFWSTAPLVGWGSYTGQYDTETTCMIHSMHYLHFFRHKPKVSKLTKG